MSIGFCAGGLKFDMSKPCPECDAGRGDRCHRVMAKEREVAALMSATLNYVADMTYCGADAEWRFKPGYEPQRVLDAIQQFQEARP